MKTIRLSVFFLGVILITAGMTRGTETVTFSSLLEEMTCRDTLGHMPHYTCRQASSYDRRAVNPSEESWFANKDSSEFVRTEMNGDKEEHVLLDVEGPGALVRWWITSQEYKCHIRIYIDGSKEPVFAGRADELVGGPLLAGAPLSEVIALGRNLYLPVPYAKSIKVTCDHSVEQGMFFYQINYRTYPAETSVESLTPEILASARSQIERTNERLLAPQEISAEHRESSSWNLKDRGTCNGPVLQGPGQIVALQVRLQADDLTRALRSTALEISFDGEETVWCPLGDFFGSGVGLHPYHTWYTEIQKDGTLRCYWPMPFRENASVRFCRLDSQPVELDCEVLWQEKEWKDDSLYFHCDWKQERGIKTKTNVGTKDWNYLQVAGSGVYVGDSLSVLNPINAWWGEGIDPWWGEGDEKIYLDGETFPSHFGTGTEDYYGYAWGCPDYFSSPFHAQPWVEGPVNMGYTTNLRFRSLDAIPFQKDFRFDMEIHHWVQTKVDYAVATFWYGTSDARAIHQPTRSEREVEAAVPVSLPSPRFPSLRNMGVPEHPSGQLEIQDMELFANNDSRWPEHQQFFWQPAADSNVVLKIKIPVEQASPKKMTLGLTQAPDYGMFRILLDGKEILPNLDLYSPHGVSRSIRVVDSLPALAPGEHELAVELLGKNEKSEGTLFGIDTILFE